MPPFSRPLFWSFVLLLLPASLSANDLRWVQSPQLTFDERAGTGEVTFELNEATDVEVFIVDRKNSIVVRHLAAGVLGPKAPSPLVAGSLRQKIAWDGKDDVGEKVSDPGMLEVRVRAGMGVSLDRMVGGDPYAYFSKEMGHNDHSPFGINGLELKPDGKVYVLGHSSNLGPPALRQYDIDGNYLRTVFPPPAGKPLDAMRGWGINIKPDGTYSPKFNRLTDPSLTTTILDKKTGGMARLMPTPETDRLTLWNTGYREGTFDLLTINTDGTIAEDAAERLPGKLVEHPELKLGRVASNNPGRISMLGPVFTCFAPDGKHYYLSGVYSATTRYGSIREVHADGFWRGGQVWKVNAATRTAEPFFSLDAKAVADAPRDRKSAIGSGKSYTALHGIAVDEDGNVFVCDRLNRRVVVLDESGETIHEIPVENPDAIAISKRTGALYVTARNGEYHSRGHVTLLKFDDWRKDDEPSFVERVSETGHTSNHKHSYVIACDTDDATNVWVAFIEMPVRIYRDDENGFRLLKDFYRVEGAQRCLGFDRIEVDRRTDEVYTLDDHSSVWKVGGDWKKPQFVKIPVRTASIAIDSRKLYLYADQGGGHSKQGISRFHLDDEYSPAPVGDTGAHVLTRHIYYEWCFTGNGDLGFAVAPNDSLATIEQGGGLLYFRKGSSKPPWQETKLAELGSLSGCVRFDSAGNLYVGTVDDASASLPGFESDTFYRKIGRIRKYAPTGSLASGKLFPTNPEGPSRIYDVPYGAFDVDCIIRSPRFAVDDFGRIYYPTNIAQLVSVIDNAGNEIVRFGTYGNRDSTGGLADDLVPTKGIPLGFPNSVATTDDHIYVGDMVNLRLLRIRKTFELEAVSKAE